MRKSKPGLSGSRRESIIGDSQSEQNGRSLVALALKNEGAERLSTTRFLWLGGSAILSVTEMPWSGPVMGTIMHLWSILLTLRILHCLPQSSQAERVLSIGSIGGRCHIIISKSKTVIGDPSGLDFKNGDAAVAKVKVLAIAVSLDKPAVDPERRIAVLDGSREEIFSVPNHQ
jgi:hypothetical protein